MKFSIAIGLLAWLASTAVQAADAQIGPRMIAQNNTSPREADETGMVSFPERSYYRPLRGLIGLGLTVGGDTLATVQYTDSSTDKVKAGGDVLFYGGADYRFDDFFSLQGTVGYHVASTRLAKNGEATFTRVPVEFMLYYHLNPVVRIGAGARFVGSPKVKIDIANSTNIGRTFADTVGQVIEAEYMVQQFGLKLRYVTEKYKIDGSSSSINGNHIGLLGSLYF